MRLTGCVCLLACLVANTTTSAQISTNGSIRGHVKDEQDAVLQGVRLTAISPDAASPYEVTSDGGGYYRLLDLPPGEYRITAEFDGFATWVRERVGIRAGLNITLPVVMQVRTIVEVVPVVAETSVLESRSAAQTINIAGEFQERVPISARKDWSESLALTPGVIVIPSAVQGNNWSYYAHGASNASHVIELDGTDISSAQTNSPVYIGFSSGTIADVQIATAGVDASTPLGLGAVIRAASAVGTNKLSGSGALLFQPARWNGNNNPNGNLATRRARQGDVSLGGPLKRDRWWFFGSYRYLDAADGLPRTAAQVGTLRALFPQFEPFDLTRVDRFGLIKTTYNLSPRHLLSVSYQHDDARSDSSPGTDATAVFMTSNIGGHAYAARLSSAWSSALNGQITVSYNNKSAPQRFIRDDLPSRVAYGAFFPSAGRLVGSGRIAQFDNVGSTFASTHEKATLSADVSYYASGRTGLHELKAGVLLQPVIRQHIPQLFPNDGYSLEELALRNPSAPADGLVAFHRRIFDVPETILQASDTSDYAIYLQDSWSPRDRLTVTAGIRVDVLRQQDSAFDVEMLSTTALGPRVGFNYALSDAGRDVVRASWSRIHDAPTMGRSSAGTTAAGFRDLYDFNLDGQFETELTTPAASARLPNREFDPDRHQARADEWGVGYRRQLPARTTVDISFLHRAYRDRPTLVEINGIYDGGVFRGYRDERLNEIYRLTDNKWNWPVYRSLELILARNISRTQIIASYTRQWRHLEGTWQPNDPATWIQPDAFANDRGIGLTSGSPSTPSDANSLSGTNMGPGTNLPWQDHMARIAVAVTGPWRTQLAMNYSLQSGYWSGPVVARLSAPDPRFGPPTVVLSNGRAVSNPLATTIRFAHPTRGEGQFHAPSLQNLNLRGGVVLRAGRVAVDAGLEILNVLNRDADALIRFDGQQQYSLGYHVFEGRQPPRVALASLRTRF